MKGFFLRGLSQSTVLVGENITDRLETALAKGQCACMQVSVGIASVIGHQSQPRATWFGRIQTETFTYKFCIREVSSAHLSLKHGIHTPGGSTNGFSEMPVSPQTLGGIPDVGMHGGRREGGSNFTKVSLKLIFALQLDEELSGHMKHWVVVPGVNVGQVILPLGPGAIRYIFYNRYAPCNIVMNCLNIGISVSCAICGPICVCVRIASLYEVTHLGDCPGCV